MAACLFLLWLVGQLDLVNSEAFGPAVVALLRGDAVDHVPGERAIDGSLVPVHRVRRDDVADPADDVVDRVTARPLDQPVDREHQLVADLLIERASELAVAEAGPGC